MTAKEIRAQLARVDKTLRTDPEMLQREVAEGYIACANLHVLLEIAAQLAELNENLTRINYIRIDE